MPHGDLTPPAPQRVLRDEQRVWMLVLTDEELDFLMGVFDADAAHRANPVKYAQDPWAPEVLNVRHAQGLLAHLRHWVQVGEKHEITKSGQRTKEVDRAADADADPVLAAR